MIVLTDLGKRFNGTTAVDGINLKISQGEIVGLLGPNGAGKTTTLRMIAGVLPPSRGNVVIDNMDMKKEDKTLKKLIGFLPENNPLYDDLTVEEYLNFWTRLKGVDKSRMTDAVDFAVKNTGTAEVFYRPIGQLSKGFRQRVGLSQVLLTKPQILILDEPTEGLDPNQRREIKDLIINLGKKRTVIISSHVLSEVAKICNRIVIIHKGRIVADDRPDHLKHAYTGKQIIEAEIKGENVVKTLGSLKGVTRVSEKQERYFILECEKNTDPRSEIFKTAVSKKWTLLTLLKKEAELEDVFSQLTSQ